MPPPRLRVPPAALAAALALACAPKAPPPPETGVPAAVSEMAEAAASGDRARLGRVFAEDFRAIYPGASAKAELAAFLARDPSEWRPFFFTDALRWTRAGGGRAWALLAADLPAGTRLSPPLPLARRATLLQLRPEGGLWRVESFRSLVARESAGWIDAALGAPPSGEERTARADVSAPGVFTVALPEAAEIVPVAWEIENAGAPVRGLRLTPEAGGVWDLGAFVERARADAPGEAALARALWRLVTLHRASTEIEPPEALRSPALFLAASGEGQCGLAARALASLWKAAGLEGRVYLLGGHAAAEVRLGGRRRLFDPDQGAVYEDGGEILSAARLARRPEIVAALADDLGRGPGGLPAREMAKLYGDWRRHGTEDVPPATFPPLGVDLARGDRLTLRWRAGGPAADLRDPAPLLRAEGVLRTSGAPTGLAALGAAASEGGETVVRFPISPWLPPAPAPGANRVRVAFEAEPGAPVSLAITLRYRAR